MMDEGRNQYRFGRRGMDTPLEREPGSLTRPSLNRDQEEKTVPQVFLPRYRPRPVRFSQTPARQIVTQHVPFIRRPESITMSPRLYQWSLVCRFEKRRCRQFWSIKIKDIHLTESTGSSTSLRSSSVMSSTPVPAVASTAV